MLQRLKIWELLFGFGIWSGYSQYINSVADGGLETVWVPNIMIFDGSKKFSKIYNGSNKTQHL